jgi:CheY-like chemotaxis protein
MMVSLEGVMDTIQSSDAAPKMLIADDDPSIVRALADRCTQMGFDVETATNGIQALLRASKGKPDILVIDVNMPEVDGLSVCAHLLGPDRKPMHVVVVTGSRDFETVERCAGFGAFYAHKGAGFWSDLELALIGIYPKMEEQIKQAGIRPVQASVRSRPRVLLVDDDPAVERFLSSRLEKCGVDVLYASDATQGYRIACREQPTVIIADYAMRNGDAQYLLSRLRTTPATENVPVIVLTGQQLSEVTEQVLMREICGHPGAARILKKPSMDTSELFEALQKYCAFEHPPGGDSRP